MNQYALRCTAKHMRTFLIQQSASTLHISSVLTNESQFDLPLSELRFSGELPKGRIKTKFTLASGPGGMNVNKVATKCEIRFNVDTADWIPNRLREHFSQKFASNITKNREFVMTSMVARTKADNLEDCYRKLREALKDCSDELVQQLRQPTQEDIEILEKKKEEAERIRRMMKERRAAKRRERRIFD